METRTTIIRSKRSNKIPISVIPGHFATNHSHVNFYIDMTSVKCNHEIAQEAGRVLAQKYMNTTQVDTIICMDGCEMIGGFMAEKLAENVSGSMNAKREIHVLSPEFNINGQMVFRDNTQPMIWKKNIVLLVASATTGKTINRCLECIQYYSGNVQGISAIFSADHTSNDGREIDTLFDKDDIPHYSTFAFRDCPDCKKQIKIDAIINSRGYSKL